MGMGTRIRLLEGACQRTHRASDRTLRDPPIPGFLRRYRNSSSANSVPPGSSISSIR